MKRATRAPEYLLLAAIVIVFGIGRPISSNAEIFKFVDKDGAIHYTNAPTSVQSTPMNLPPLTQVNFQKYFPIYKGYQGYQPGAFSPFLKPAQPGRLRSAYKDDMQTLRAGLQSGEGSHPGRIGLQSGGDISERRNGPDAAHAGDFARSRRCESFRSPAEYRRWSEVSQDDARPVQQQHGPCAGRLQCGSGGGCKTRWNSTF